MKLTRKLAALAMAVLLAVSLTACSPKQVAQDMVVHLVHKLGLVEESDEDDTDTTTKAPAGGSVEFPAEMDTTAARVVTYPVEDTLYVSFNGIANRSTEYFVAGGDSMTLTLLKSPMSTRSMLTVVSSFLDTMRTAFCTT